MDKHTPNLSIYFERDEFDSEYWHLRIIDANPLSLDHPQGPLTVATINVTAHAPHLDEPLANAALFRAAPKMLAALRIAEERISINNCEGEEDGFLAEIRAAIRLATDTSFSQPPEDN